MKFPQIFALSVLLVSTVGLGQTKSLTTLPVGFSFNTSTENLKTTLNSEKHKILFAAFEQAELEEILGMTGPFTVFAPTNHAFSKFSSKELEVLFRTENRRKLKDLLTYHMVAGNLTASKILRALCRGKGKASFTTVQGNKIFATIQGTDILLTDGSGNHAKITVADSEHTNGVIHQIDRVILPPGL
ncbi:MAG: fasciclin domain-containing protein [Bacteroidota bacterium]